MEDRIPLSGMPIYYTSPIEREATDILSVYYEGEKTRRDWEIAITELEKLDERCMDITTEIRLIDLYRREYGDWEHGNINGMAYWRRKMLYTAAKPKLYNDDALMLMFDNLNWMWYKLDFAAAKYIGKDGYGYEIDNPIVTTGWEYPLLLNSLKPEKANLSIISALRPEVFAKVKTILSIRIAFTSRTILSSIICSYILCTLICITEYPISNARKVFRSIRRERK